MAAVTTVCKFYQNGYCKFESSCKHHHGKEICQDSESCKNPSCTKRHPRKCRYFSLNGRCKFGNNCAYLHFQSASSLEVLTLKNEIEKLTLKIKELEANLNNAFRKDLLPSTPPDSCNDIVVKDPSTASFIPIGLQAERTCENLLCETTQFSRFFSYTKVLYFPLKLMYFSSHNNA